MSLPALINKEEQLEALAFALARNECGPRLPVEEVLQAEGVSADYFMAVADDAVFKRLVKGFVKDLTENGVSFQMKARIQAEALLKKQFVLIHDPETPPAVAVKAIENTVRWAGLEPKTTQQAATSQAGPGFQLVINIPAPAPAAASAAAPAIDVTPLPA